MLFYGAEESSAHRFPDHQGLGCLPHRDVVRAEEVVQGRRDISILGCEADETRMIHGGGD